VSGLSDPSLVGRICGKHGRARGRAAYGSSMCSTGGEQAGQDGAALEDAGQPGEVARLGRAIEELAEAARERGVSAEELTVRLARVWGMVAELDPELARRRAAYDS
jgi:hypothetical protein